MKMINLQIPVSEYIKKAAQQSAEEMGFSSLQETIRLFLKELAEKRITFTFMPTITLSEKTNVKYQKIVEQIEEGVGIHKVNDARSLMKKLKK